MSLKKILGMNLLISIVFITIFLLAKVDFLLILLLSAVANGVALGMALYRYNVKKMNKIDDN